MSIISVIFLDPTLDLTQASSDVGPIDQP
jgi:hypothetical protein